MDRTANAPSNGATETYSMRECRKCARMLTPKFIEPHGDFLSIHWPGDQPVALVAEDEAALSTALASWLFTIQQVGNKNRHVETSCYIYMPAASE